MYPPQEVGMGVQRSTVIPQGVVAGMIGYAVVVLAYAALNLAQGRNVFATAAQLGAYLVNSPPGVDPGTAAPIIAFNGVHLFAALLAGIIVSWLVAGWERNPGAGYFFLVVMVAGLIMGSFLSAVIIAELAHAVAWATVLIINMLAAAGMVLYLFAAHPHLRHELPRLVAD
jgi:hypothetical protein